MYDVVSDFEYGASMPYNKWKGKDEMMCGPHEFRGAYNL
jgi:hypothetical protein